MEQNIINIPGGSVNVRVGTVILDRSKQILLGKLKEGKEKDLWVVPVTDLREGEDLRAAAVRAAKEEMNITVKIKRFVCLGEFLSGKHSVTLYFVGEKENGLEKPSPTYSTVLWLPINEFIGRYRIAPYVRTLIKCMLDGDTGFVVK